MLIVLLLFGLFELFLEQVLKLSTMPLRYSFVCLIFFWWFIGIILFLYILIELCNSTRIGYISILTALLVAFCKYFFFFANYNFFHFFLANLLDKFEISEQEKLIFATWLLMKVVLHLHAVLSCSASRRLVISIFLLDMFCGAHFRNK